MVIPPTNRGKKRGVWRRKISTYGYVLVGPGLFEHRVIMEKFLNRSLNSNEIVHHKDGNRRNNQIENLLLMSRSEHLEEHNHVPKTCLQCGSPFKGTLVRKYCNTKCRKRRIHLREREPILRSFNAWVLLWMHELLLST